MNAGSVPRLATMGRRRRRRQASKLGLMARAVVADRGRPLTEGEWERLSRGLVLALKAAAAEPCIVAAVHPAAAVAALWRGSTPILTRGDAIWWPRAPADFSRPGAEGHMMTLQHELQHVLDYRTGFLSAPKYLLNPRHWSYHWRWSDGRTWERLGAEQRAVAAETIWRLERDATKSEELARVRRLVPWAA